MPKMYLKVNYPFKRRVPHLLGQTPGHFYHQWAPGSSETSSWPVFHSVKQARVFTAFQTWIWGSVSDVTDQAVPLRTTWRRDCGCWSPWSGCAHTWGTMVMNSVCSAAGFLYFMKDATPARQSNGEFLSQSFT